MKAPDVRFTHTPGGQAIAYYTDGSGTVDILLLANPSCVDMLWEDPAYAHMHRRLAALGRLVVFDYRSCGSSDPLPSGALPAPEEWISDMQVVLDAVESTSAVIIAPGPLAAAWALLFAAIDPGRVSALVVIDGWARTLEADDYPIGMPEELVREGMTAYVSAWGRGGSSAMVPSRSGDPDFCNWLARFERMAVRPSQVALNRDFMLHLDLRSVLGAIHVPVLVVQSDANPMCPVECGRYLAEHIEGAQLVIVPGPGENIQFSAAASDAVIDAMEKHIALVPSSRPVERTLATVLFTDIVDSTGRAREMGDRRWAELLAEHLDVAERHVARNNGRLIKSTGDGIFAAFDGPARAIVSAQSIAASCAALGLSIRAGVHTGEVERQGDDLAGIGVHIGARVAALAGGSEILVTSTVKDLVAGSGLKFDDLGLRTLKGVDEPWHIYAVRQ